MTGDLGLFASLDEADTAMNMQKTATVSLIGSKILYIFK